ncbi:hypothetical protein GC173_12185 [bacterium]|nr:hypothetical protein [bacterium]
MSYVARLLLREEIDALELELSAERRNDNPDLARIQELKREVDRLENRLATAPRERPRLAG